MTATSEATSVWNGTLFEGSGTVSLDSSTAATKLPVNWQARAEGSESVTTPEELLGAAHAACFNMQFANMLAQAGSPAESIQTTAAVTFAPGSGITGSHLLVSASVPGISEEDFERIANEAKATCPVSQALTGTKITIEASLG
jgi:osmotically inducible protein OsmC